MMRPECANMKTDPKNIEKVLTIVPVDESSRGVLAYAESAGVFVHRNDRQGF